MLLSSLVLSFSTLFHIISSCLICSPRRSSLSSLLMYYCMFPSIICVAFPFSCLPFSSVIFYYRRLPFFSYNLLLYYIIVCSYCLQFSSLILLSCPLRSCRLLLYSLRPPLLMLFFDFIFSFCLFSPLLSSRLISFSSPLLPSPRLS